MRKLYLLIIVTICIRVVSAQPVIAYQTVISGLTTPVDVVNAGDGTGKLYIVQQGGIIDNWNGTSLSAFLDVSSLITNPRGQEQGLLSLAFHPSYSSNGYFFIYYTNTAGDATVARYKRDAIDPTIADPASGVVLISVPKPGSPYYTNHNGGKLNFGTDGMLYFGLGDGGSGGDPDNNAQDLTTLRGKMLRINVNGFATTPPYYTIPASNPFVGAGGGIKEEIWDYGLRNPWRWSFDRTTHEKWIADVGQNAWEEVDVEPAASAGGVNYGWRCYEGTHTYNTTGCTLTYTSPIFEYGHNSATGGYSITGGYVYRGPDFASLTGYYVTADYVSGNLWLIKYNGSGYTTTLQSGLAASVASFGEGEDGVVYVARRSAGTISKLIVTSVVPVTLANFVAKYQTGYTEIKWETSVEQNLTGFTVQYSDNGREFFDAGFVSASGNPHGSTYSFMHYLALAGSRLYRLVVQNINGSKTYSNIITVRNEKSSVILLNTNVDGNYLSLLLNKNMESLRILSTTGNIVYKGGLQNKLGITNIQLPFLSAGMYIAVISNKEEIFTMKFIVSH